MPALYFEFQDCAGCTEALLRAPHPTIAEIVLDLLSLNYHETIMAPASAAAEAAAAATIEEGGYLLLVEGAIPLKDDGIYCCIAGRTAVDTLREAAANAVAAIAMGSCASFGNIPAANPNPTGAVGLREVIRNIPVVNMAGCPPNAMNLAAIITHYLTFGPLPALDHQARPTFAYLKRESPRYTGANPVAAFSYLVLGALILLQGLSGIALYVEAYYAGGLWRLIYGWMLVLFNNQTLRLVYHFLLFLFGIYTLVHIYMMALGDVEEGNAPMTGIISGWKYEPVGDEEEA